MFKINVTHNLPDLARYVGNIGKQARFATAVALTRTAQDVQRAVPAALDRALDRPTDFTKRGTYVLAARKDKLESVVGFKQAQAKYMAYMIEGGVRRPKNVALRLPTGIKTDAFGNLPKGAIKTLLAVARKEQKLGKVKSRRFQVSAKVEIFYGDPADVGVKDRPAGIYKIVKQAGGKSTMVSLVAFPRKNARYRARFDFAGLARQTAGTRFAVHFQAELRKALASAR